MKKILICDKKTKKCTEICCEDDLLDKGTEYFAYKFADMLLTKERGGELWEKYYDGISFGVKDKLIRERMRELEVTYFDWNDYVGEVSDSENTEPYTEEFVIEEN